MENNINVLEVVTIIKEIITALVAIAAVVIAAMGLNTWREQLRGTTRYKIAKDVIEKTLKLRDVIGQARNPLIDASEMSHAEWSAEKAHAKRLNEVIDAARALETTKIEAHAVFGRENIDNIGSLIRKVNELINAFNFIQEMKDQIDSDTKKLSTEARQKLYGRAEDEFGKEVLKLVERIEEAFRKYLK